ncbi:MAG TPA: metallophosphoesterase [Acetobacteraceae bacterium]|nr:metallophosphoesterase [Acetobacteraceae bacterium]
MTRIAHITDLHFGAEDPAVVAGLLTELNADAPDLVAISGDLTMGARRKEFRAAHGFIGALRVPWLAVPGNHDMSPYRLWQRFTDPYLRWREWVAPETEPSWRDESVAVFGLNTAHRAGLHWDWSRGRVTRERLCRLLARLAAVPAGMGRVVVAHHPLIPPPDAPNTPVAGGASAALRALGDAGVNLVLAGHLHRGYARLAFPEAVSPLILQGATATSVRLRGEPNAYNRVTIDGERKVTVETRIWDGTGWTTRAEVARDADPAATPAPGELVTSIT